MAEGSDVYLAYIQSLLAAEEARKTSFESRGITVITTSGTLVTLLFGLVAVVTGAKTFQLPTQSHGYLIVAIICFAAAVFLGILVNTPFIYPEVEVTDQDIARMTTDGPITADVTVAMRIRSLIDGTRRANNLKSYFLLAATAFELAALIALTVAVIQIITKG